MAVDPTAAAAAETTPDGLLRVPLDALHRELGARMSGFAGYDMPIQYPTGLKAEHLATRSSCGLFDVSHMGQLLVRPRDGRHRDPAAGTRGLPAARFRRLAHRRAEVFAAAQRTGRHRGRPDAGQPGRRGADHRQRRQPRPRPAPADDALPGLRFRMDRRRADRLAGAAGGGGAVGARSARRLAALHGSGGARAARRALLRDPLRLHRRGRLRDLDPVGRGRTGGAPVAGGLAGDAGRPRARATRCGWKRACRCTATTSGRTRRRSRRSWRSPSRARGAATARRSAGFPGAEVVLQPAGPWRRPQAGRPGVGRSGSDPGACADRRWRRPPGRRGHQRHHLADAWAIR